MKKEIILELHREEGTNNFLLDSFDVFDFVGENTKSENMVIFYVGMWCAFLNYPFIFFEPCNESIVEEKLRSWLREYNFAKGIDEQEFHDKYVLTMRGYIITLYKPYSL